MSRLVRCTCKSYCLEFNPETQSFEGEGHLIPKSTAANHRRDDQLPETLDDLAANVASRVLRCPAPPDESLEPPPKTHAHAFALENEILRRCTRSFGNHPLVFAENPSPTVEYQYPAVDETYICNRGPHALLPGNIANTAFLENESRLCEILRELDKQHSIGGREFMLDKVQEGLVRMRRHKEMEWNRQRIVPLASTYGYGVVDTSELIQIPPRMLPSAQIYHLGSYFRNPIPRDVAISTSFLTILILHLFFRTPRRATTVLIAGLRSVLQAAGTPQTTLDLLPKDPRTIVNKIDLDPRTTPYLQCPACYALYPYPGTTSHELPPNAVESCTHRPTPESDMCGVPLWEDQRLGDRILKVPRRKYIHQSLKEWVGRLLSRPGVEDILDAPHDQPAPGYMGDIWDSPVLRNFHDTNNEPFFAKHGDDLRFAFSLGADSFHPLGSLEAKQSMSATAIYMVLLNLPKDQRFKYKNMYLAGVIPGPSKPSLEEINHALSLLVDELLEFWKGIYFTRTYKFPSGRFSKGAMIALVCDMLAARQVAGFGSVTSTYFCTCCLLTIQDVENLQKQSWPERILHDHLECARRWRDGRSKRDRERLFRLHGIRWSALQELPYWNPILFTVLDSMHAAFLGLFQSHCRKVWKIDVSVEGGDGSFLCAKKPTPRPSGSVLTTWLQLIRTNPRNLLERLTAESTPKSVLWHICVDNGLRHVGGKLALSKSIIEWVRLNLISQFSRFEPPQQRSGISPDEILLPQYADVEDMDVDQPDASGSNGDGERFRFKVNLAEKDFLEFMTSRFFLRRVNLPVLQEMCHNRGLDDTGSKMELYQRLENWVSSTHRPQACG